MRKNLEESKKRFFLKKKILLGCPACGVKDGLHRFARNDVGRARYLEKASRFVGGKSWMPACAGMTGEEG
jgi:hypothetical protein